MFGILWVTLEAISMNETKYLVWPLGSIHITKNFLDSTVTWIPIAINSLMAFLTFQLYQANRAQTASSSQQNTRQLLGSKFEEALATIDSTNDLLQPIYKEIMEERDLYIRNGIKNAEEAIELRQHAVRFGQRLQLYSLANVDAAYTKWLNVVLAVLSMVDEIESKSKFGSHMSLVMPASEKDPFMKQAEKLFTELTEARNEIMLEMRSVVKVDER